MKREIDIKPTVHELAACFAEMGDEDQAQFFVEVAKEMEKWGAFERDMQLNFIAGHLADCSCVSQAARDLVTSLATHLIVREERP